MTFDFDQVIDRRETGSYKWILYPKDVLPLWVADMDFQAAPAILKALKKRVEHGIFGYQYDYSSLSEAVCRHLKNSFKWEVLPENLVFHPGILSGLSLACQIFAAPAESILVHTPAYPPFLTIPRNLGRDVVELPLVCREGRNLSYEIDFDHFEKSLTSTSKVLILCHPQNPVGRSFTKSELIIIYEICKKHNVIIFSDEAHCDLILDNTEHIPLASISEEIFENSITVMTPCKTFNLPGLGCAYAIIKDQTLRKKFRNLVMNTTPKIDVLGLLAAEVAYNECYEWLQELKVYLRQNRDFLLDFLDNHIPQIKSTKPSATYLAWLDCRSLAIEDGPFNFFLNKAKVALTSGADFGNGWKGFLRLNFGCPRATLAEALQRMKGALG